MCDDPSHDHSHSESSHDHSMCDDPSHDHSHSDAAEASQDQPLDVDNRRNPRASDVSMSAEYFDESNAGYFAELNAIEGVYSFAHPGGEFEVHCRDKGRFWAPKFQCQSTWQLDGDGTLTIDFKQYGKYALQRREDGTFRGSAVGKPGSWRTMEKLRSFSTAERAVMDSRWEFEHAGGRFEVEFRADAFNHFVCEAFPAHSHWRLDDADTATPTLYINWGKFGEYELEIAADGASASGSVKGRPEDWRKMKNLGVLGANLKVYAEHDH